MDNGSSGRPDTSDMVAVHRVFRTTFSSAPALVGSIGSDDGRRGLIADYYANVLAFLDVHHRAEDVLVFPLLAERAPMQKEVIERMKGQHEEAVALLGIATDAVGGWTAAGAVDDSRVTDALVALGDYVGTHLDDEEESLLPIAGEHLTVEEWAALPGYGMANFTGDKVWLILGLIREQMTEEQRAAMLAEMPPPARNMWETMGEAAFDGMIEEVRRPG